MASMVSWPSVGVGESLMAMPSQSGVGRSDHGSGRRTTRDAGAFPCRSGVDAEVLQIEHQPGTDGLGGGVAHVAACGGECAALEARCRSRCGGQRICFECIECDDTVE